MSSWGLTPTEWDAGFQEIPLTSKETGLGINTKSQKSLGNSFHCWGLESSWKVASNTLTNVGIDFKQMGGSKCSEGWVSSVTKVAWLWSIQELASFWLLHLEANYSSALTPRALQWARLKSRASLWLWLRWKNLNFKYFVSSAFCLFLPHSVNMVASFSSCWRYLRQHSWSMDLT